MRTRLICLLAYAMVLLIAAQALLPRDLVWCVQQDGDIAFELSHGGRCVGAVDSGCVHLSTAESVPGGELLFADGAAPCEDFLLPCADGRHSRLERLQAPEQSCSPAAALLPPVLRLLGRSILCVNRATRPPDKARLAAIASTILRI